MKRKTSRKPHKPRTKKTTDADRRIFTHTVAGITIRIDPLEALFRLRSFPDFDWEKDPIAMDGGDPGAMERTMQAVNAIFGVTDLANGGLTITERMELLLAFTQWCDEQKKTSERMPTSLPTSDLYPEPSTTPELSDSISTPSESSCDEACLSASEPAAP
jgi:hypothetical protein